MGAWLDRLLGRHKPRPSDEGKEKLRELDGAIRHWRDGTLLRLIPEGDWLTRFRLPAYYLARNPVTNAQYARFLTERRPGQAELKKWIRLRNHHIERKAEDSYAVSYPCFEDHSVVQVSWYGAEAYCEWAYLRLPTECEWESGMSWGLDKFWQRSSGGGDYWLVGSYEVREWCADWYDAYAYKRYEGGDLRPPASGDARVFRSVKCISGISLCGPRDGRDPAMRNDGSGFRCAKSLD